MVISQSRKGKNYFLCQVSMVLEKESILFKNAKSVNRSRMDNAMTKSKGQWKKY